MVHVVMRILLFVRASFSNLVDVSSTNNLRTILMISLVIVTIKIKLKNGNTFMNDNLSLPKTSSVNIPIDKGNSCVSKADIIFHISFPLFLCIVSRI